MDLSRPMSKRRIAALGVVTVALTVLLAAELVIPSFAERRVRSHARDIAEVESVDVRVRPAIKALWGDVDSVDVRLGPGHIDPAKIHDTEVLGRLGGLRRLHASAPSLTIGGVTAERVDVSKVDKRLRARFSIALAPLQAAMPGGKVTASGASDGVTLKLSMPQLPIPGGVQFRVTVDDGALVAEPQGQAAAMLGGRQELLAPKDLTLERMSSRVEGDQIALSLEARL